MYESDISIYEGDTLYIKPQGYDSDEDTLFSYFSGWKVDYDESFNDIMGRVERGPAPPYQEWYASSIYNFGYDFSTGEPCYHPFYGIINNSCAAYKTKHSDIGEHTLFVYVNDSGGLGDYQKVKIFIDDIPNASFVMKSIYKDFKNDTISVEDPVIFDSRKSVDRVSAFGARITGYSWNDKQLSGALSPTFQCGGIPNFPCVTSNSYFALPPIPFNGDYEDSSAKFLNDAEFEAYKDQLKDIQNINILKTYRLFKLVFALGFGIVGTA